MDRMRFVRQLLYPLMLCVPFCLLSGCWSSLELNKRAFARLILVDKTDKGIELTLGLPLPNRLTSGKASGGETGGQPAHPFTFVTKSGRDIGDAFRKIQSDLPRRINFGHTRNVVLGKAFAQSGIGPAVDFLSREAGIHINSNVYIADGKAKQLVDIPIVFEKFPSEILTQYARQRVTLTTTVKDMLMSVLNEGDITMPMLLFGTTGAVGEEKGANWMGTGKAAMFRHGKMVGTLDEKETMASQWILDQIENAELTLVSPSDSKDVNIIVRRGRTQVKPIVAQNQIGFLVHCQGEAVVISTNSSLDLADSKQLQLLEQSFDKQIETRLEQAIGKSKSVRTDAFQFGRHLRWWYPQKWNTVHSDWRQTYASTVEVKPQVDISLKWFGAVRSPEFNKALSNTDNHD